MIKDLEKTKIHSEAATKHNCCGPSWSDDGVQVNVAYDADPFDKITVSLTLTPLGTLANVTVLTSDTLALHEFIADTLKLIETPTCTSKQPTRGIITGAKSHVTSSIT